MSERQGEGWWMASDGKWYPPDLHPSVRDDSAIERTAPDHRMIDVDKGDKKVGPQFPDLFAKAMEGNHLADTMSVRYDGDDERNLRQSVPAGATVWAAPVDGGNPAPAGGADAVGAFTGASAPKRRWRRH